MKTITSIALCSALLATTAANATLVGSADGKTVWDADLGITWLANANLAYTETFGLARNVDLGGIPGVSTLGGSYIYDDGGMTWGGAMKWIAAMNDANYLGYSDWRLPTTTDTGTPGCNWGYNGTDCGYNSTGSEMAHLYYTELGNEGRYNTAGGSSPVFGLVNKGSFTNFWRRTYWSGTEYALYTDGVWAFNASSGDQYTSAKDKFFAAMVVRPGQVAAASIPAPDPIGTVPAPAAAWLLGSGLLGLIGVARRKAA